MDMDHIKIDTQAKSAFTRTYNQKSHPLPYMKASQVVAPTKKSKERPDLEEALDESDSGVSSGEDQAVLDDDKPLDLKKDKYVAAPKKKKAAAGKKAGATGKGKGKVKDEDEDEEESEEDVKPKKGKGRAKK
jgi:replication factor C subunit 1